MVTFKDRFIETTHAIVTDVFYSGTKIGTIRSIAFFDVRNGNCVWVFDIDPAWDYRITNYNVKHGCFVSREECMNAIFDNAQ